MWQVCKLQCRKVTWNNQQNLCECTAKCPCWTYPVLGLVFNSHVVLSTKFVEFDITWSTRLKKHLNLIYYTMCHQLVAAVWYNCKGWYWNNQCNCIATMQWHQLHLWTTVLPVNLWWLCRHSDHPIQREDYDRVWNATKDVLTNAAASCVIYPPLMIDTSWSD